MCICGVGQQLQDCAFFLCIMAFIHSSVLLPLKQLCCEFIQQLSHCWDHFQRYSVLNSAIAVCDS